MKKKRLLLVAVAVFLSLASALFLPTHVQAQETMVGVSGGSGGQLANPGRFMTVNQTTGAVTLLGTPYQGCGVSGVATNSSGRMYAVTSVHNDTSCPSNPDDTSHLIEINPSTGALISDIGPLLDASGNGCAIGDLSFQPGTNILFGLAANQSFLGTLRCGVAEGDTGGYLLTINTTNARYTIIGRDASLGNSNGGIAFAPNGTLYFTPCWDNPGSLLTLNPATAAITSSVALANSNTCYMGLGIRPSDGAIFASFDWENNDTSIYILNPSTGTRQLVGDPGNIMVADLAFTGQAAPPVSKQVPTLNEWGMIIFMLLSGAASIYYLRRQKRA